MTTKKIKRKTKSATSFVRIKKQKSEEPLTYQQVLKLFQETREQMKETDKRMKELQGLFTTQWGKLVEALLGKGCLAIFKRRGININRAFPNATATFEGRMMEVDVLLANGKEVVFIEVKTTAKVANVKELVEDLKEFKIFFPYFKDCKVYGGIAALKFEEESPKYAASQGLFVIESTGEGLVQIRNAKEFIPKAF